MKTKIQYHGFDIIVRLRVGVSVYPSDGKKADTLLKKADDAMYAMKASNKAVS